MARLFRLLPDPSRAHELGSVDPPKITLLSLAAVAERAQSLQRTAPSWRAKVQCSGRRRSNKRCATTTSTHSACPDSLPKLNLVEPPWYGPVCPVVGEGWHREVSPYPDLGQTAALALATLPAGLCRTVAAGSACQSTK